MLRTDIVHAMNVTGELAELLENLPEARTADGQIDHERTDRLIECAVHLRNAELVLMQAATGLIPTSSAPALLSVTP